MASVSAAAAPLTVAGMTFGAPWALLGIIPGMPILWRILRSLPPKPKLVDFAPMMLLPKIFKDDTDPAQMPWWQKAVGVGALGLASLGLSQPDIAPDTAIKGSGPLLLVVDNDWAAAQNWSARMEKRKALIDSAAKDGHAVVILRTASPANGGAIVATPPLSAADADRLTQDMQPMPWPTDRGAARAAFRSMTIKPSSIAWLSNGLDSKDALALAQDLKSAGALTVFEDAPGLSPHLLLTPETGETKLTVTVRRVKTDKEESVPVIAHGGNGAMKVQANAVFKTGEDKAVARFDMPTNMQNQVTRLTISGEKTAGSVVMLDERWRRRPVGIVGGVAETGDPLTRESHYLQNALYSDIVTLESVENLFKPGVPKQAVIIVPDAAAVSDADHKALAKWVRDDGGTLLRFAGPNLAAQDKIQDDLLPVDLVPGGLVLGGTITDPNPGKIGSFEEKSPLRGLKIPEGITIDHEILARPGPALNERTWARLSNGSPLITARQDGKGRLIFIHTTANSDWSNLASKTLFINILRKIVMSSQGMTGTGEKGQSVTLKPWKLVDGFGQFAAPSPFVQPLTNDIIASNSFGPHHPPGLYGQDSLNYAHNLAAGVPDMKPLTVPEGVSHGFYEKDKTKADWADWAMVAALALVVAGGGILRYQNGPSRPAKNPEGPA